MNYFSYYKIFWLDESTLVKRIAFSRALVHSDDKGQFVVYSRRQFVIPLELLKMAEEEYGLRIHGPITLSCDAVFMEYVVSLIQRHPTKDLKKQS